MDRMPATHKGDIKQLGRGMSETTVANGEDVDAALWPNSAQQSVSRWLVVPGRS